MLDMMKSDFLKLIYNKLIVLSLGMGILLYGIYLWCGEIVWVSNVTTKLGFYVRTAANSFGVNGIDNLAITSVSYTFLYWVIALVFIILFYGKEYKTGMIKLAIIKGADRIKIYLSKLIISIISSLILYYIMCFAILIHSIIISEYRLTIDLFLTSFRLITLNGMVLMVFVAMTLLVCILMKNEIISFIILFVSTFASILISASLAGTFESGKSISELIVKATPMYYWMNISGCNFNANIMIEVIVYFIIAMVLTVGISCWQVHKQDIR